MTVVVVESPAKAKTINKYLGKDFTVLASYGHVRDLPAKDGSVRPDDAVAFAAKILKEQLQIFINFEELPEPIEDEKMEEGPKLNENLYRRVDELELSVRSANCLQNANIKFIGELCQKSEPEMLKTKNFGRKSLNEIKEILSSMGLSLGMKLDGFSLVDAEKFRPKDVE